MKLRIDTAPPTLFYPAQAEKTASELRAGDPDWTYKTVVLESGWARIDIFDEDGEFVASVRS